MGDPPTGDSRVELRDGKKLWKKALRAELCVRNGGIERPAAALHCTGRKEKKKKKDEKEDEEDKKEGGNRREGKFGGSGRKAVKEEEQTRKTGGGGDKNKKAKPTASKFGWRRATP